MSTSESDLAEEKSFDLNYDTEEVSDDVNAPTDNEIQDSLLDIEVDKTKRMISLIIQLMTTLWIQTVS